MAGYTSAIFENFYNSIIRYEKIREIPKDFPLLYWFTMKKNKGNS